MHSLNILCVAIMCLSPCFSLPVGPRIPDGNSGSSVNAEFYMDSGVVGFHEIEGVSKYIRVGKNPKEQTIENNAAGQKLLAPGSEDRQLLVDGKPEESFLTFLNRQILSIAAEDEPETKKQGYVFDNLEPKLEIELKRMTWEFQKRALAAKESLKNDSEREEELQKIERDIDTQIVEIRNELGNPAEIAEQESELVTVGDAIKRRMRLIFSHNVHYDKDSL
ncbi:uncharacterized protein [Antedon mediterranea]|uniref:uncharacterized protein n=1 Tax=Antedon mediterranea TaxID=105859 RepID=UPI003AF6E3A3